MFKSILKFIFRPRLNWFDVLAIVVVSALVENKEASFLWFIALFIPLAIVSTIIERRVIEK